MSKILILLLLCAAYLQGGGNKFLDFQAAVGEVAHFGLPVPPLTAAATIALELGASFCIIGGFQRRWAAIALALFTLAATLLANRFWDLPAGEARFTTANAFFEHLGLIGGFLYVALAEQRR